MYRSYVPIFSSQEPSTTATASISLVFGVITAHFNIDALLEIFHRFIGVYEVETQTVRGGIGIDLSNLFRQGLAQQNTIM